MVGVMVVCWVIGPVYNIPTVIATSFTSPNGVCYAMAKWPSKGNIGRASTNVNVSAFEILYHKKGRGFETH